MAYRAHSCKEDGANQAALTLISRVGLLGASRDVLLPNVPATPGNRAGIRAIRPGRGTGPILASSALPALQARAFRPRRPRNAGRPRSRNASLYGRLPQSASGPLRLPALPRTDGSGRIRSVKEVHFDGPKMDEKGLGQVENDLTPPAFDRLVCKDLSPCPGSPSADCTRRSGPACGPHLNIEAVVV